VEHLLYPAGTHEAIQRLTLIPELIAYKKQLIQDAWDYAKGKYPDLPARPYVGEVRAWGQGKSRAEKLGVFKEVQAYLTKLMNDMMDQAKATKSLPEQNRLMEKRFLVKNQLTEVLNGIEQVLFNQQWNSMIEDTKKEFPHPNLQPHFDAMKIKGARVVTALPAAALPPPVKGYFDVQGLIDQTYEATKQLRKAVRAEFLAQSPEMEAFCQACFDFEGSMDKFSIYLRRAD
jgi:hypothetical protein